MTKHLSQQFFSSIQTIVFKQIGNKIPTNALKQLMDRLFIIAEKVGNKFQMFSSYYLKMYQEIVGHEIDMADLSSHHRILVIGCGSLPATAVLFAMKTNASVVSIDKDQQAVCDAVQYVKQFHLGNHLIIIHADGFSYPLDHFNVIVVLYGVKRPQEMLESIAGRVMDDTKVIFRTIADKQGNILDSHLDITKHFLIKGHVHSDSLGSVDSFLLMKKPIH